MKNSLKYSNIYDLEGNLIRHVGKDGKVPNYTIEELEELVDKLAEDKDENGNIKDPVALNNVNSVLIQEYNKHPEYMENFRKKIAEMVSKKAETKSTEEQVKEALEDLKKEVEQPEDQQLSPTEEIEYEEAVMEKIKEEPIMDQYVDFEEIIEENHE